MWKTAFEKFEVVCPSKPYFWVGVHHKVYLVPFLNNLTQIYLQISLSCWDPIKTSKLYSAEKANTIKFRSTIQKTTWSQLFWFDNWWNSMISTSILLPWLSSNHSNHDHEQTDWSLLINNFTLSLSLGLRLNYSLWLYFQNIFVKL